MKSRGGAFETVLVVDDDESIRRSAARVMRKLGRRPVTAASPPEALDILRRERVDLAVLDVVLGEASGIDLLKQVKGAQPHVIAVVISGFSHAELVQRAYRAGAHDFFEKPFEWPDLLEAVERGHAVDDQADEIPSLETLKVDYYKRVLESCDGNVTKAAERAGIHRTTLQRIIRQAQAHEGSDLSGLSDTPPPNRKE